MQGDRLVESQPVKDGMLDSTVALDKDTLSGRLQSEWQNIREGLGQGFNARKDQAQDNLLITGVEVAGSFGVGAALTAMAKSGGKWGAAADVAGKVMLLGMAGDIARRGYGVADAYSNSTGNILYDKAMRRDAIAQNLGTAGFDYPLMMLSGMAGSGAVQFGPKIANSFRTSVDGLRSNSMGIGEMQLAPAYAGRGSSLNMMELGELGRLGAKEVKGAKSTGSDPLASVRETLDAPHKSASLDQLSALMEAKRVAAHPEVKPIYQEMADTLSHVDKMKPTIARDELAIKAFEKEIGVIKSLKAETQAAQAAEATVNSLKADLDRLPTLQNQESGLTRQIADTRKALEARAKQQGAKTDEAPLPNMETLRSELTAVKQDIAGIRSRAEQMDTYQAKLDAANRALAERTEAIKAGTDPAVIALEQDMIPLQSALEGRRTELQTLTEKLQLLDKQYATKAAEVLPTLGDAFAGGIPDVPKYVKPQADAPAIKPPNYRQAPEPIPVAEKAAPRIEPAAKIVEPKSAEPAPQAPERTVNASPERAPIALPERANNTATDRGPRQNSNPNDRAQAQNGDRGQNRGQERDRVGANEKRSERAPETPRVTAKDVDHAFGDAQRAVEDFTRTTKRHTTALKKVNDYIDTATNYFATDVQAANSVGKIASNVESLLGKLENWERAPGWIRAADRVQVMQKHGFDAATMSKFDKWYETQNQLYIPRENMPELKLMAIQEHLQRRVAVESVKNWLRTAPEVDAAVSPIVQKGFQMMAEGKLPDGRAIPKGSDLIVFEERGIKGPKGDEKAILPFAKDGDKMQRFDDSKIAAGIQKMELMRTQGPEALSAADLYGFRLDHDPSRLMASYKQVGFAVLRPGGAYGKNILHMEFAEGLNEGLLPRGLRADSLTDRAAGTNTGVLYNMLRNASGKNEGRAPAGGGNRSQQVRPEKQ